MARIYQYPACSTCKKALAWLRAHDVPLESVHIVDAPPSEAELKTWIARAGLPIKAWFNTAGEVYRAGGYKDRVPSMDAAAAAQELARNGKLIKRPLLVHTGGVLVGFDESAYARTFAK